MMYGVSSERRCKWFDCKRIGTGSCFKRVGVHDCSSCYHEGRCSSCKHGKEMQQRPYSSYICSRNEGARSP